MTKKVMNDIVLSKKSIRQIPISKERATAEGGKRQEKFNSHKTKRSLSWQRKPLNPKFVLWLIASICLLALFFGISIVFSSATVIITPKTEKITFDNDLYIAKINSSSTADLSFEVLKVKQTVSDTIEATEEKEVNQKATGKIIIYNSYSTASQRLINNTRFESNKGKIYRINSSVVVPGLRKIDGKIVPGSIEATVFADQAGEDYNLKAADLTGDFKIPGFKGDPRYEAFYARLKDDILGGYIGKQMVISDGVRKTTEDSLKTKLNEQLLKELYAVKPENFLFLKNGYSVDYIKLPDTTEDGKVKINIEGDLSGIVFNNTKLSKYIATKKIDSFDGLPTELIPSSDLLATFNAKDNINLWKNSAIEIKLSGDATIKWLYDGDAIKKDLAGKSESDIRNLVTKYKDSVDSIQVIFKPVWTRYIPDNTNKIKIKEALI